MRSTIDAWRNRLAGPMSPGRALLLLTALIAPFWIAVYLHLSEISRSAQDAAQGAAENLARGVEQNMARTIEGADQLLRVIQGLHIRDPDGLNISGLASLAGTPSGFAVQLSIVGPDGKLAETSSGTGAQIHDLSDRNYIRFHLLDHRDQIHISEPLVGRLSGRVRIHVSRPLHGPDGRFDGIVVVTIDSDYLGRFLNSLRLGDGVVALIGRDGVERVRAPATAFPWTDIDPAGMQRLMTEEAGSYRARSPRDGLERLFVFRALENYPMVAVAGIDLSRALAADRITQWRTIAGAAVSSAFVLAFGLLTLMQRRKIAQTSHALTVTLARMTQGVVMADPNGRVVLMNDRARDLLELPRDLARPGFPVAGLLDRLGPLDSQTPALSDLRERITADGRTVETQILPLPEGGLVLTSTDVTTQRAAIAAREAARASAEAANRAKSDFLATMSHEIRTPMNGVMGMIQVLRHSGLDASQRGMCEIITRSAKALLAVLNDILDYSKLEAGRITLEPLPTNLTELVDDVAELMRGSAEVKGVGLRVEKRGTPPTVLIDPTRVRQILLNMLSNAVKFSDLGTITITLDSGADPDREDHVLVTIAVRDQGIGIAPEALPHLFTRFTQADASSTRRFGGSGLGLAISRELARLMDGDITVRSQPDMGSEFTITLPAPITTEPALTGDERTPEDVHPGPPETLDILVAEDDEVNRAVIGAFLQPDGHRVVFAVNGVDAVLAVQRRRFDIILMDVMMPGMDGPTATARIRELRGPGAATPIVALTANAMAGDRERYLAAGMNGYVSKPIERRELWRAIESLLGVKAFTRRAIPHVGPPAPAVDVEPIVDRDELDALLSGLKNLPLQIDTPT